MTHLHESFDPAVIASERDALVDVLRWFVAHGKDLAMDVRSGHDARRQDASEEMRREDYEFRLALSDALTRSVALLAKIGGDA
jgi:predicted HAD superfamily phosphohydrolase